jgi:hypothetical protein
MPVGGELHLQAGAESRHLVERAFALITQERRR